MLKLVAFSSLCMHIPHDSLLFLFSVAMSASLFVLIFFAGGGSSSYDDDYYYASKGKGKGGKGVSYEEEK